MHRTHLSVRCLLLAACCLLLSVPFAQAAGNTVGPNKCTMTWTQQAKNADGSALTDLKGWNIYVYTAPGQPGTAATVAVTATAPNPTATLNLTFDCKGLTMSEGQKYAIVKAVDLGLLESAPTAEAPFVWNAVPPMAAESFVAQ